MSGRAFRSGHRHRLDSFRDRRHDALEDDGTEFLVALLVSVLAGFPIANADAVSHRTE